MTEKVESSWLILNKRSDVLGEERWEHVARAQAAEAAKESTDPEDYFIVVPCYRPVLPDTRRVECAVLNDDSTWKYLCIDVPYQIAMKRSQDAFSDWVCTTELIRPAALVFIFVTRWNVDY